MVYKVLTNAQVDQFMELGWIKIEGAIPREAAINAENIVWENLELQGFRRNAPSTWTRPVVHLTTEYGTRDFPGCNSERLDDMIDDLVGEGRFARRGDAICWGLWPTNLCLGADEPWDVPTGGWHYDGQHFRHYIDSPEQGLLILGFFTETKPMGGGTLIAEGSHHIVAKVLAEHPGGLEHKEAISLAKRHPWLAELSGLSADDDGNGSISAGPLTERSTCEAGGYTSRMNKFMNTTYDDPEGYRLRVVEATASPGDIYLCHPFLFHSSSQNHAGRPRTICNKTTPLKERMNLNRSNPADYSPVEMSIRRAINRQVN
jgi:hypothetical protein